MRWRGGVRTLSERRIDGGPPRSQPTPATSSTSILGMAVAVFKDPVSGTIEWAAIENLLVAAGANVIEGNGSRVKFEKDGIIAIPSSSSRQGGKALSDSRCSRIPDPNWSRTMNTMTYNGYHARIEFDAEDELFCGKIAGISDVVGFHGDRLVN